MNRFYLPPDQCSGDVVILSDREAHHALHVLRVREGDPIEILDGAGTVHYGHVLRRDRSRLQLAIRDKHTMASPPCRVTLLAAIPKAKAFDTILQKATELGVTRIVPILSARVVVKTNPDRFNLDKWTWVTVDAIKQCGSPWLPQIEPPQTLQALLDRGETFDLAWVASLASTEHPRSTIQAYKKRHHGHPRSVAIWIGPEGDFTPEELDRIEQAGATPISLGTLVLRADTAAIYALSILNYELSYPEESK